MSQKTIPDKILAQIDGIDSVEKLKAFFTKLYDAPRKQPAASTTDYGLKKAGKATRTRLNEQCRNILATVTDPKNANLTVEQLDVLKQYSGKGGLDDNSVYEYYTPTPIAEGVWDLMKANGYENGSVLDPCTGAGVFSATKPAGTVITGCDLDPVSSKIAQVLNPTDNIKTSAFEDLVMSTEDDTFDCAIGNVPFGDARGENKHKDPAYKKEKLCQRYFILRALDKIRPGGLACFVCPPDIIQSKGKQWENFRLAVSDKAEFLGAHKLPTGTFAEQGTQTVTDVVVFKKHPKELLQRIKDKEISPDTMRAAKAYWDEFVTGKYWQGEGKRFIHGKFIPKDSSKFMDTDKVIADSIDNTALKKKLATKFQSRIDWDMLEAAQDEIRTYREGDVQFINGEQHVFKNGEWEKLAVEAREVKIDKETYGVDSMEALKARCEDMQSLLGLSLDNIRAIRNLDESLLPEPVKQALSFASRQKSECQEQIFRGSVIGSLIAKMARDSEQGKEICETRDRLQELVLAEYEKFGDPKGIKKLSLAGRTSKDFGLFMNAVKDGEFSDLLAGKMEGGSETEYDSKNPASIVDYLSVLRDGEPLDFDEIKDLYTGDTPLEKVEDLADFDSVAIDPDSGMVTTLASYCTGDVYPKIDACKKALVECENDKMRRKFQAQVDEICKNRTWTKASDIAFSLRSTSWLDKEQVLKFLEEQGYDRIRYGEATPYVISWGRNEGKTDYRYEFNPQAPNGVFYYTGQDQFTKQLVKYLNGSNPTSNTRGRINDIKDQIGILESTFSGWMQQQENLPELEEKYNRLFNGYVAELPNSADLHLENLSGEIHLHGYQNEEIRRLSNLGCGICGFGTGLGKSFTALGLAAYNLKKGKFRRTCIVVPSAVLENWYNEASQMFDADFLNKKMFFVGIEPKLNKDGSFVRKPVLDENGNQKTGKDGKGLEQIVLRSTNNKAEIYKQMWQVPQSNYSIVVMTKEKFASIPIDEHITADYMEEMVARNLVRKKEGKKSYKEDKRQAKLKEKFSDTGRTKAEELPTIEQMGFDSIITDESHFFKNSLEGGKESQNLVYAANPKPSQIAMDMSIKSHYIRKLNGGTGTFALTATPVTNSPLEIFNMLALITNLDEFKAQGIDTPDKFIQFFAKIKRISKADMTGALQDADAVVGFRQLDALRNTFGKYCKMKTVEDVDKEIFVPNKVEYTEEVVNSSVQEDAYKRLRALAKGVVILPETGEIRIIADEDARPSTFSVIRDMDRVSTDMDMFWHTITFTIAPKYKAQVEKAVKEINGSIKEKDLDDYMVASKYPEKLDYSIVKEIPAPVRVTSTDTEITVVVYDFLEKAALKAFTAAGITDANGKPDVGHPIPPKYAKLIENIEKYFKADPKGKQIIFTDEKSQHNKLARILERNVNGLEPGRIGIINAEEASGPDLDRISKAFNSGEYLLVIANKKAEVGVNLQKGTRAIHHLTLPWTPASINQRNGRGVRQGNKVANVDVYYYCGKGTFDEYRADILKGKANWIQQILSSDALEAENADFASEDEMAVMLAENPEEQRRLIAEQKTKKAAAEEQRKNKLYGTFVGQYLAAKATLDNYDSVTEEGVRAYKGRIVKAKANYYTDEAIARLEEKLDIYIKGRENGKPRAEAAVMRAKKQIVNAEAGGEKLPFNFAEIEGKEADCIVIPATGLVLVTGDYVQAKKDIGFRVDSETTYKVVVDKEEPGTLTLYKAGDNSGSYSSGISLKTKDCVPLYKVTISQDELAAMKLLERACYYYELHQSGITKEAFFAIRDKIRLTGGMGVFERPDGSLAVTLKPNDGDVLSYPEPENQRWKDAVLKSVSSSLDFQKFGYLRDYMTKHVVSNLFGLSEEEFSNLLKSYLRYVPDEEAYKLAQGIVKGMAEQTYNELVKLQPVVADKTSSWHREALDTMAVIEVSEVEASLEQALEDKGYSKEQVKESFVAVSNAAHDARTWYVTKLREEIQKWDAAEAERKAEAERQAEIERRRAEAAAQQTSISEPNDTGGAATIPSLDQELVDNFAKIDIDISVNKVAFATKFRNHKTTYPAGSYYMLFDRKGYNGNLKAKKDILKSEFGAKYTKDYPPEMGKSFWLIPVEKAKLPEIWEILA